LDFEHVVDLANAHLVYGQVMFKNKISRQKIYNVGTGKNKTLLELINEFETKIKLNYKFGLERSCDLEMSFYDVELIFNELGWKANYYISDCVKIN